MSIIKILTNLLTTAYRREADALDAKSAKVADASNTVANLAIDLAGQAERARDHSIEMRSQSVTLANQATALRKRGDEVAAFFAAE